MSDSTVNTLINDLLIEIHRSLMQYAAEAWLWSTDQAEELRGAVLNVAERQREDVGRLYHLLNERRHYIDFGVYPHEYTSLHYVSLEYLVAQLKINQAELEQFAKDLLPHLEGDAEADQLIRQIAASEREALLKLSSVEVSGGSRSPAWMK